MSYKFKSQPQSTPNMYQDKSFIDLCEQIDKFDAQCEEEYVSNEGVVSDFLGDGIIIGLVGLYTKRVSYLKQIIPEIKNKLMEKSDWNTADSAKSYGFLWQFNRCSSRYLPEYSQYFKECDAVINLCNYIASVSSVSKLDPKKVIECFKGSDYLELITAYARNKTIGDKFQKTLGTEKDAQHTLIQMWFNPQSPLYWITQMNFFKHVGIIGWGTSTVLNLVKKFLYDPDLPVGRRGWDTKDKLIKGLDKANQLILACEKTKVKLQTLMVDRKAEERDLKIAEGLSQFVMNTTSELGRGIVIACKKVAGNWIGRIFRNMVYA